MQIACPACQTRYSVPDGAIPAEGRTVRCAKCRHSWFEAGEGGAAPAATPAPPAPTSGGWDDTAPASGPASAPEPHFAEPETRAQPMPADPAAYAPPAPVYPASQDGFVQAPAPIAAQPGLGDQPFARQGYESPSFESEPPAGPAYDDATPTTPQAWPDVPEFAPPADVPAAAPAPIRVEPMAAPAEDAVEEPAYEQSWDEPAPRKSPLKLILVVLLVLLAVAAAAFAAVRYYGAPSWLPVGQVAFAPASDNLELDFPADKQDRRTLPNGLQFFAASGTVTNVGRATERVPDVQVVLRDAQDRIVYTWELEPPKRELAPGETLSINEAVTDVPASARVVEIGWKAG